MRTFNPKTTRKLRNFLLVSFFFYGFTAMAQPDYYIRTDSTKGYWKIQTDFASQQTRIRFFNSQHEPIYQENLAGRYVKLTNRTIRLFDSMLERLLTNQLLSAEVKSHELVASSTGVPDYAVSAPLTHPISTSYVLASPTESLETNPLRTDVSISSTGKLKIHAVNLRQEPVLVTILDDQGRSIFKQKTVAPTYNRTLNLSQLQEGTFRFEVIGLQKKYYYRLVVQSNPQSYQLRAIP
ncbi:hypothetical protein GCM10028803_19630 [Larkinella knui]|uniref:T9SS C-terminal target domain-containing protein n=1 Tax=Larkinella knui TaxID=2025310 RepID=A0A3P1CUX5_9BACT|nr:hypothetical protein [Larkinella knui]RRB17058.1 hypothetical protein EHT87_01880 [Larkinella knui]